MILALIVGWFVGQQAAGATGGESFEAFEITVPVAVGALPESIRPLFEAHLDTVKLNAAVGLAGSAGSGRARDDEDRHYVMLDIAAVGNDVEARRAAARRFPHNCSAARKLFKSHDVRQGGMLPWVIKDRYHELVRAFRAQDGEAILRQAGILLRLATDASLPFNTTANRDGQATGHLGWSADQASAAVSPHRTVRHRCQVELIRRAYCRFEHEVRVWPERFQRVTDPTEAIFEVLLETHDSLAELLEIDTELLARLNVTDVDSFLASSDAYYDLLADRAGPIMESRLEVGALLAANLIGAAWAEAGSPPVTSLVAGPTAAATPGPASPEEGHPYVGSRNSTVFHRVDCPHATRIKLDNRVYFSTIDEARAAGRAPCKACRPDGP